MAAAGAYELEFQHMSETRMREWVEANPGRVNHRDMYGFTPLVSAACKGRLSLAVWLLDEKGADVNGTAAFGRTALYNATSPDVLIALLDRGANPSIADRYGIVPLMQRATYASVDVVARLLQDPRVRATINVQDEDGNTALHQACVARNAVDVALKVNLLLQAGANPVLTNKHGMAPLGCVRQRPFNYRAVMALEQALAEAEKASLLVKARRLAVAAKSNTVAPSCLQARVARRQPLPRVALMPLTEGETDGEDENAEDRKFRTALAFMCGVGREAMPRDVFRAVLDLVMPSWDPLRRKNTGTGPPVPQG